MRARVLTTFLLVGAVQMGLSSPATARITSVATGGSHACAVWDDGRLKCWGANNFGQLGLEDSQPRGASSGTMGAALPFVNLGAGAHVEQIALGEGISCALLRGGAVKCWGYNGDGAVAGGSQGLVGNLPGSMGDSLPPVALGTGKQAVSIAVGYSHACAVLDDSTARCWGRNQAGQLGLGDTVSRGRDLQAMGDQLPPVALGDGFLVRKMALGSSFSCALSTDGRVKCWGISDYGQVGSGANNLGTTPDLTGNGIPYVDIGHEPAVDISAGTQHVCVRTNGGAVKCWGANFSGSLGQGNTISRGKEPGTMGDAIPETIIAPGLPVSSLSCGYSSCCALLANQAVKCWGDGQFGALGYENQLPIGTQAGQMGNNLPYVSLGDFTVLQAISLGGPFACAVVDPDRVRCWGRNANGQLGYEDTRNRGDRPQTMGASLRDVPLF